MDTIKIGNLHTLLDYDARRFVSGEVQLIKSLGEWIHLAASFRLKEVLQKYQGVMQQQVLKLESFVEKESIESVSLHNRVMNAFIEDTVEKLAVCSDPEVKDACLLACVQAINHYKISMYGTAAAFAKTLGMENAGVIFHEAEVNEKKNDDRLSQLAEFEINIKAKTPIVLSEQ